jgi:hypothetical protein
MAVTVRIPTTMRPLAGGSSTVKVWWRTATLCIMLRVRSRMTTMAMAGLLGCR